MKKIRFSTEDSKFGLTEAKGFLWSDRKGIHVEFRVTDTVLEVYKTDVTEVFIPYHSMEDILFKNAWFSGGDIKIILNTMKEFDDLPFLEEGELIFSIERKQKNAGKDFVVNAKLEKVEFVIAELDKKRDAHL